MIKVSCSNLDRHSHRHFDELAISSLFTPERSSWSRSGRMAFCPNAGTVGKDHLDAFGCATRIGEIRNIKDCLWIEQNQIGKTSALEHPAALQTKGRCGQTGHFVHCCFQREQVFVPGIMPQHPWKGTPCPGVGMLVMQDAIRPNHSIGVAQDALYVVFTHLEIYRAARYQPFS